MRDGVTLQLRLLLAGCKLRIIPVYTWCLMLWNKDWCGYRLIMHMAYTLSRFCIGLPISFRVTALALVRVKTKKAFWRMAITASALNTTMQRIMRCYYECCSKFRICLSLMMNVFHQLWFSDVMGCPLWLFGRPIVCITRSPKVCCANQYIHGEWGHDSLSLSAGLSPGRVPLHNPFCCTYK